ncbi:hypothetical protein BDR26DRAFT_853418 [Obelidium mucronatum]|nr:hypothetical protein BDR26DRAFT_853418 [Obelidium mucronatum]
MTRLFVSNGNNTVVIDTAFGRGLKKDLPLEIVADVVAAFFPLKTPEELSLCFLHLPQGVAPPAMCRLSSNGAIRSGVDLKCLIAAGIGVDDDSALIVKAENPLGGAASTVVETIKLLTSSGPVDPARNILIPFDQIPWANELFRHVDAQDSVLLHGHWQSGKTSALRSIKRRAEAVGTTVYYLDVKALFPNLSQCVERGDSMFAFLASELSPFSSEYLPRFIGAVDFCRWVRSRHHGHTVAPILLLDEYDAFLMTRHVGMLSEMNSLISFNRNEQECAFSSIVCAGTFSIVAAQTQDPTDMDVDNGAGSLGSRESRSDDSLDAFIRPISEVVSPWNKTQFIETKPFDRLLFKKFAMDVYFNHKVSVSMEVPNEILETTCGHPGFSIWLLMKSVQLAIENNSLSMVDWLEAKRSTYNPDLCRTPTMASMLDRVKSSKQIADTLHVLVRENQVTCHDIRLASFLRAVGVARPWSQIDDNTLTFTSPVIRDCLLQHFYPPYDMINEIIGFANPPPSNFLCSVLLTAIKYIKAPEILDPLVSYAKGLAEAPFHAELYRILRALFRKQYVAVLTETRVVSSSDMRCDLWLKSSLVEFGIEIKTECDNKSIQKDANPQIVKYASCREPKEMMVVNFVRKEVDSITFPINIEPIGWDKYPQTKFTVLFVDVIGSLESGVSFRYAVNGDESWRQFT